MTREELQIALKTRIARFEHEFMDIHADGGGYGIEGTNPTSYRGSAEIRGGGIYFGYRDEDVEHHHIPMFGFKFTIGRTLTSPYSLWDEQGKVTFKGRGMSTIVKDESKVTVRINLREDIDFFAILDLVRAGNRFAPLHVTGDEDIIKDIKTRNFLRIDAYVEEDEVHAFLDHLGDREIEQVIAEFIDIFVKQTPSFDGLKPLYQETDAEGTRLWADRGLQSPTYYQLKKKLGRKLLRSLMSVLRNHNIPYETTWSISYLLSALKYGFREYGPFLLLTLPAWLKYWLTNLFKSQETLRQERLRAYKEETRKRGY